MNPTEIETLYEQNVDALYAFVYYRVGGDQGLSEDIVGDTFAAAIDRISSYEPSRGSVRSWLCTLSRNIIRRHLNVRRREAQGALWDAIDQDLATVFAALDEAPLSDELLARQETRDLVGATVANLPDNYREVLEQKYVGDWTIADMARERACTEDAMKSLLARARRAFRDAFLTVTRAVAEGAHTRVPRTEVP